MANYNDEDNTVLLSAGKPLEFEGKNKKEAMIELRDALASLRFNLCRMTYKQASELKKVLRPEDFFDLNRNLSIELNRNQLTGDIHLQYMEFRKRIYNEVKWTNESNWEAYKERDVISSEDAFSFIEAIDFEKISAETYVLLKTILEEKKRKEKYEFIEYMKRNWDR